MHVQHLKFRCKIFPSFILPHNVVLCRSRSISKFPGYDLVMVRLDSCVWLPVYIHFQRYFHDSKEWSYRLNEEPTNELMKRAENILCTAGLISNKDRFVQ